MRICQLSHVEQTYNFLRPLFDALAADGHEVVAACTLESGGREARRHLGDGYELHQVPAARQVRPSALTTDIVRMARYLRRERFDVVQVHGPLVSVQARIAARLARVPLLVYQAHGFYFHDGTPPLRRALLAQLERVLCRHLTDVLVTVNEEDAALARREGFRPDPRDIVHVPGVGIDTRRFRPVQDGEESRRRRALRAELGAGDALVVLFVGRLVAEKGVLDLLAAARRRWARGSSLHLWLVGDLLDSERDKSTITAVREQAAEPGCAGRIRLLGRRHDVEQLLRAADVLVLPSYREGMPVSLLEGMSTGLPVITTDIRGCRESVEGGRAGLLVPPGRPEELASALQRVEDEPELRLALGAAARRRVLEHYCVERSTHLQVALFRTLEARLYQQARSAQ